MHITFFKVIREWRGFTTMPKSCTILQYLVSSEMCDLQCSKCLHDAARRCIIQFCSWAAFDPRALPKGFVSQSFFSHRLCFWTSDCKLFLHFFIRWGPGYFNDIPLYVVSTLFCHCLHPSGVDSTCCHAYWHSNGAVSQQLRDDMCIACRSSCGSTRWS